MMQVYSTYFWIPLIPKYPCWCFPPNVLVVNISRSITPSREFSIMQIFTMQQEKCFSNADSIYLNHALCLNLFTIDKVDCQQYFWVGHGDIKKLTVHFQLPEEIVTPSHADWVLVVEGLWFILHILSYLCCWFDLQIQIWMHISALSNTVY